MRVTFVFQSTLQILYVWRMYALAVNVPDIKLTVTSDQNNYKSNKDDSKLYNEWLILLIDSNIFLMYSPIYVTPL